MAYSRGQTLEDFLEMITYEDPNGKKRCAAESSLSQTTRSDDGCKTLVITCYLHCCLCLYNRLN